MKYAQQLAQQWVELIQQRQNQLNNNSDDPSTITPAQTLYLVEKMIPILVESLSALLQVHETEERAYYQHNKQMRKNPAMKPMQKIQPLEWIASYLVRHNPKHVKNNNAITQIYDQNIQTIIQTVKTTQTTE